MATKNIFRTNGKNINITTSGKLQFNTSTEFFRNKVQLFADGINKRNDKIRQIKEKLIATQAYLKVVEGETVVSSEKVDEVNAQIEKYKQAITDISTEIASIMPEYDSTDKNLFYAYRQYVNDEICEKEYFRAVAEWLDNGGIAPTVEGIRYITKDIGKKKASSNEMIKSNGTKLTSNLLEKAFLDMFYRTVAQMMYKAKALKEYEYEYKLPEKTKKSKDTAPETATPETTAPAETTPNA